MYRLVLPTLLALAGAVMASPFGGLFAGERPGSVGNGTLSPCPGKPNCVSSRATDDAHRIAPIPFADSAEAAMRRLAAVAAALPGARVVVARPDYLYVEFVSRIMGFVDDFEAVPDASGTIHVRSSSRVGRSDFGVNRARIESLREAMAKR
jgi:uncharacterized protein (DUF1499 family)